MKIVFLVHRYWPSVGGVEKYIHELGRALLAMGHQVEVVAGAHTGGLPPTERHDEIRIRRFPAHRSPLRCRAWLWRRRSLFAHADVVSVSNTHMLEYYWRMLGPLADPRKVFLIRHGMACNYPVPDSQKLRARRSLDLAAGVIHDGQFIEKWLAVKPDLCPDQGLNPEADRLPAVPEPEPDSAIYIGRLEPDTGIRIYLDAISQLTRRRGQPFTLHVYGDGMLMTELRATVEQKSLPVVFHGRTPNAQDHITDSCFAFLDGRMAIQEAMARRRMVLAAYVDPLKRDYVAGESFSPYLIAVAKGADLAERATYYIDHPGERAILVQRAFEHSRKLTWARTGEAYVRFWQERLACPRFHLTWPQRLKATWTLEREAPAGNASAPQSPRCSAPRSGWNESALPTVR